MAMVMATAGMKLSMVYMRQSSASQVTRMKPTAMGPSASPAPEPEP